ncbi:MAG TPA: GNAT family N-acetyltransferase [Devosia sp.]|nr:GNAT family N-acetyltransferase [Devosia sp.]
MAYAIPAKAAPVTLTEVTDAKHWDRLLALAPHPQLTQTYAYGAAKATQNWHVVRVCLSIGDKPIALCQVLEKRVLGIRVVSRINRGPTMLEPQPSDERVLAVYRAIRQRWGHWYSGPLSIAPTLPPGPESDALLRRAGYIRRPTKVHGWWSGRIDLAPSLDAIRAGFASTFRNRLKKSLASGLTLRVASDIQTVDWMIERHIANMREKGFSAVDADFLTSLRATAPHDYVVFQAIRDGQPIAGMSVIRFGDIAEYHTGWFGPEGRDANAGNFLMWSIMAEMKGRGCAAFDVGGLYEGHGYTQFKRGMRPRDYQLVGEWVAF